MTQKEIDFTGAELALKGMQQAIDHADAVSEKWSERAYDEFVFWLCTKKKDAVFKTEDFRVFCELNDKIPKPPSKRAFGGLPIRAAKSGLITKAGYTQTVNPKAHNTPCTLWKVI